MKPIEKFSLGLADAFGRRKASPTTAQTHTPQPSQATDNDPWDVLAMLDRQCRQPEISRVRSLFRDASARPLESGTRIPFLRAQLPYADISRLAELDECVHLDLNRVDDIRIGPVRPARDTRIRPCTRDVFRKVKEGVFREAHGKGVTVGILDTGFTPHRLLPKGQVRAENFTSDPDARDGYGHGTFIIGQWLSAHEEFAGLIPGSQVTVAKIFTGDGGSALSWILRALDYMLGEKPDVLSNSWGCSSEHPAITMAMDTLIDEGIVVVASAGNEGNGDGTLSTVGWPARMERVVCVGSINKQDNLSWFSSTGARGDGKPDCVSYGERIQSLRAEGTSMGDIVDEDFVIADGTSFSCPVVTAEIALTLDLFRSAGKTPPHAREFRGFIKERCCQPVE